MKMIELSASRGFVKVSDEDYEHLSVFRWHFSGHGYAYRAQKKNGKQTNFLMHRELMEAPSGMVVDHINGDRLDNRRENLRLATYSQNNQNSAAIKKSSSLKGVSWHTSKGKWRAVIKVAGISRHIGYFGSEEAAACAYQATAIEAFGSFARVELA